MKKKEANGKKVNKVAILMGVLLLIGIGLVLYPSVAEFWNSYFASRVISSYTEDTNEMKQSELEKMIKEAKEYNRKLAERQYACELSEAQQEEYESILDISGTGIMGYVDIPSIDCTLPIYHGVDEGVLRIAAGHLEWSSFPVGGKSTHAVISGHRGLPSAKLFSNIGELTEGDIFMIYMGNDVLTYKVDQIRIVLPEETDELLIQKGKDYCSLVTCTPYGVNSHRLLVRGVRTGNRFGENLVVSEAVMIDRLTVAAILAVVMWVAIYIALTIRSRKRKKKND